MEDSQIKTGGKTWREAYDQGDYSWLAQAAQACYASHFERFTGFECEKMVLETIGHKHHDYGPENITRFGAAGVAVRLWDKIARLENLLEHRDGNPRTESVIDTYLDIVGYCVIVRMLQCGTFLTPMASDL